MMHQLSEMSAFHCCAALRGRAMRANDRMLLGLGQGDGVNDITSTTSRLQLMRSARAVYIAFMHERLSIASFTHHS